MVTRMPADPAALDQVFAARGGFAVVYKRLVAFAQMTLVNYGGDSASRVALRQLQAEEVVDAAFERYFDEGAEDGDVYFALRRHIKNQVRSAAKSVEQKRTVRVDGSEKLTTVYNNKSDPTDFGAVERVEILDDFDFCKKLIFRILEETKDDQEVAALCEAIVAGFREYTDICEFAKLERPAFDAAMKRLKRKFSHTLTAAEGDLRK